MKLAILQDYLRIGGTETQSIFLANAFADGGHTVVLITFRPGGALRNRLSPEVQHIALQPFDTHLNFFAPRLNQVLNKCAPDVVLCMGRMGNRHAPKHLPTVVTARTGAGIDQKSWQVYKRASAICCNSAWVQKLLHSGGIDPAKTHVIRNAFTRSWQRSQLDELRKQQRTTMGCHADTVVLLCVAAFRKGKGQEDLIDIAANLGKEKDWQLWLVGDGQRRRACTQKAHAHGLEERIHFFDTSDPIPMLAGADVFTLASKTESLPNALVEAQWAGLPIIAYDTGGCSETFSDGSSGCLIKQGDKTGFAEKTRELMNNTEQRRAMAAQATLFFDKHYANNDSVLPWMKILEKVRG